MNCKSLISLKKRFQDIQLEINKLKSNYNYDNGFSNNDDIERFMKENKSILEQSNQLRTQIEKLEWELKSPEEQAQILEQRRLSRLKREGKLFDEMD